MSDFKLGCMLCHQIGSKPTRSLVSREAYDHGTKKARNMYNTAGNLGRDALLDALADWSGRIAKGETPKSPPRPKGLERNLVITQWEWGDKFTYAHDEIATDRNNPRRNANGKVWGVDIGNDRLLWVDPVKNTSAWIKVPTRGGFNTPWCDQTAGPGLAPSGFATLGCPASAEGGVSAYAGKYRNPGNPHNPMMDSKGRVWITTQIRREWVEDLPAWCQRDPFTANRRPHRQLAYYDPKTKHWELIDTCFATHHLQFDKKGVLWLSNDGQVIGWFDPSKYVQGRPETAGDAQGWSRRMVDTNGDGVADTQATGSYGVIPNDVDGSVWSSSGGGGVQTNPVGRGNIQRYDPATGKHESYYPPLPGFGPRGIDSDSKGIMWTGLGGSGHLASFDRSKCRQTWGNGDQCPEGWTLYKSPGPSVQIGAGPENGNSADFHYYIWVDKYDTLGMGKDTVILNGTASDSLLAFSQKTKKFTVIRIPYPLALFTRGADGRIDDPKAGWKGRGLWFDNGIDPVLHSEKQMGYLGKVQLRPSPIAR
jgi:streptogramin lyase